MATRARVTRSSSRGVTSDAGAPQAASKRAPAVRKVSKPVLGDTTNQLPVLPEEQPLLKPNSGSSPAPVRDPASGGSSDCSQQAGLLAEMLNSSTTSKLSLAPEDVSGLATAPQAVATQEVQEGPKAPVAATLGAEDMPGPPATQEAPSPGRWDMDAGSEGSTEIQGPAPMTGRRLTSVIVKHDSPPAVPTTDLAAMREPHPEAFSDDDDVSRDLSESEHSFADTNINVCGDEDDEEISSAYRAPQQEQDAPEEAAFTDSGLGLELDEDQEEAGDDICDALDSLSIGAAMPLVGVPVPAGKHIRFTDEGEAVPSPGQGKVVLRGMPAPAGTHMRFDD